MAMNVAPFQSTDEFSMAGFNGKISDINSGVDNEITSALSGFARIETGSYVGTGKYGESNPNTLTFGFIPKLVTISAGSGYGFAVIPWGGENGNAFFVGYGTRLKVAHNDDTISWYAREGNNSNGSTHSPDAEAQMNSKNITYYYIAIG